MNSKPTILVIASSVDSFTLKDGRKEHTGYYLNELDIPVQAALDAGYQWFWLHLKATSRLWTLSRP